MEETDSRSDFIEWLGRDMSIMILMCLDDPSDIVRASAVSSSWRRFVITNGIFKQFCLKMFPEFSSAVKVIEKKNLIEPLEINPDISMEWEMEKRDHRVYACLAGGLSIMRSDCIGDSIRASSTDNYPEESIHHTLDSNDGDENNTRITYWSSKGESDPTVPETLIYKLQAKLCVISEVHVQPFQAFFQYGFPTYAAKAVRFRMGHQRKLDFNSDPSKESDEEFVWTYTSPEFPMAKNNSLQKFKLPEPVICIGGILQVELLGRVQTQEMDNLYYICVSNVQAVGRLLASAFNVEILNPSGACTLNYHSNQDQLPSSSEPAEGETSRPSRFRRFTSHLRRSGARQWEQMLLRTLLGTRVIVSDIDDHHDEERDESDADEEMDESDDDAYNFLN